MTPFDASKGTALVSKCVSELKFGPWYSHPSLRTVRIGLTGPGYLGTLVLCWNLEIQQKPQNG